MKRALALLLAVALMPVSFAGSISRSGSSFSRSSSAPSAPARNMGLSRPSVAPPSRPPEVRTAPRVAPTAPVTSPSSYQAAPTYAAPAPMIAPSTGSTFMSSMGGALVGSMVGNALTGSHGGGGNTTVINGGGGGAAPAAAAAPGVVSGGGEYAAPVAVSTSSSIAGTIWSFLLGLIGLSIIFGLIMAAIALYRNYRKEQTMTNKEYLPFSPVAKFLEVQRAFAACDSTALRGLLGQDMVDQAIADLPEEPTQCKLVGISYEVLDVEKNVISIAFTADDLMDNTKINETWHFTRNSGAWLLNGIEQN